MQGKHAGGQDRKPDRGAFIPGGLTYWAGRSAIMKGCEGRLGSHTCPAARRRHTPRVVRASRAVRQGIDWLGHVPFFARIVLDRTVLK